MTAIPGTQMPSVPTAPTKDPDGLHPSSAPQIPDASITPSLLPPREFQIMNVAEIKKTGLPSTATASTFYKDPEVWYNTRTAWLAFGTGFGVLLILLGLIHSRLFYLAPMGPAIGGAAWYARNFFQKHAKKFDAFGKLT